MAGVLNKLLRVSKASLLNSNNNPAKFAKSIVSRGVTCQASPAPQYSLRIAYMSDYDRIMHFMADTYFKSEPSIVNIGLGNSDQPDPLLFHTMFEAVHNGLTIIALDRDTNCIVGAAVNCETTESDIDDHQRLADKCDRGPGRDLVRFFCFLSRQADPWSLYHTQKVFECANVAVHPEHQGQGLARRLIQESWVLARDMAHRCFRIDASSLYTAKIAESYLWSDIYSYPYRRYWEHGRFIFNNIKEPHTQIKIFADRLDNCEDYYPPVLKCKKPPPTTTTK